MLSVLSRPFADALLAPSFMSAVDELWDLKGCADDKVMVRGGQSVAQVHKRWFRCHWLVAEATCLASSLPQPRRDYYQGKRDARKKVIAISLPVSKPLNIAVWGFGN